jgi:hypothetical protein
MVHSRVQSAGKPKTQNGGAGAGWRQFVRIVKRKIRRRLNRLGHLWIAEWRGVFLRLCKQLKQRRYIKKTEVNIMAKRDYESAPISDLLGMKAIIDGLAHDLQEMRDGTISPQDGLARAAVAKQIFNGVRLFLQATSMVEKHRQLDPIQIETSGE